MKSDHQKPVTLEDLLRLKRAERPSPEFWSQFERELRAKQLAALVVRRPWWQTLPGRAFAGLSRYHLPLGATAVLALTFFSVREYQTTTPSPSALPVALDETMSPAVAPALPAVAAMGVSSAPAAPEPASADSAATDETPAAGVVSLADTAGSERVSAMAALIGGASESTIVSSPSSRSIAENFAAAHVLNPLGRGVDVSEIAGTLRYIIATPTLHGQVITLDAGQRLMGMPRDVAFMVKD